MNDIEVKIARLEERYKMIEDTLSDIKSRLEDINKEERRIHEVIEQKVDYVRRKVNGWSYLVAGVALAIGVTTGKWLLPLLF